MPAEKQQVSAPSRSILARQISLIVLALQEDESAVEFANRVKASIAEQGGLVDLEWCEACCALSCSNETVINLLNLFGVIVVLGTEV